MHHIYRKLRVFLPLCLLMSAVLVGPINANQSRITTPLDFFGHNIGDDYFLATYTQAKAYWTQLAQESDRMILKEIGLTEEGRPMIMAIITSPANHANLARCQEIAQTMALAKGLNDEQARGLAREGRAVVWIDGGLHATEVVGAQQEIELAYRMVSGSDPETLRILDNVILLALFTNPDGMDMVSGMYMRESDPQKRSTRGLPRLYQKYVGHDNNRDFILITQKESEAVARILYREWFPQIVYNHHQTGPSGCVLFAPPFREPHSYNFDPLLVLGITTVGNAMHSRFAAEGKPGATMREGAGYQTWWNGCLRCTPYFHNMIGILTEMIGHPTPMEIPFIPQKHLPNGDYPYPIGPQTWRLRQSIEYSQTANRAILDLAAKLKEDFLFNIYRMGKNSIERGGRDHWTMNPRRIEAVQAAVKQDKAKMTGGGRSRGYPPEYYHNVLHDPALRDPRGYILPSDQPDFLTAGKFVNALLKSGVSVLRATDDFRVAGKSYPSGSFVVKTAQAFRPHVIDMFEPQVYPDDRPYPGGPPRAPYDSAGYTLAFQMGIEFDRILDGFDGPFSEIKGMFKPEPGHIQGDGNAGYLLSHQVNDSFIGLNRLFKSGEKVFWMQQSVVHDGRKFPAGTFFIPAGPETATTVARLARDLGLDFTAAASRPAVKSLELKPVRIGIWDRFGGSMSSGWVRWLLEQYEFDFQVVYPPELDAGDLNRKFDALIFVSGSIPAGRPGSSSEISRYRSSTPQDVPEEYQHMAGRVTADTTIPQLKQFLEQGGAVLTIGSSTNLAYHLNLPVANALVEQTEGGGGKALGMTEYFVPGSVLRVRVDNTQPLAHGMPPELDVYFNRSPVYKLTEPGANAVIKRIAWFDSEEPLRSGWANGQHYLKDGLAVLEAAVGKGTLFMFGPEITFRALPQGNFKFLFNGLYYGAARKD
jgi:hypothetical protein